MIAARPLLRLATLLILLALAAGFAASLHSQAAAQPIPEGCDVPGLNDAIERKVVPDFHKCSVEIAAGFAARLGLQLDQKREPSDDTDPGLIARQEPDAGSVPPENGIVAVFLSTGPPPAPQISAIKIDDQSVAAGQPLEFDISIEPADAVGELKYSPSGGTAQAGRDYVADQASGGLAVGPDQPPPSITIDTKPDPAATGDLTLVLRVTADGAAPQIVTGTIRHPVLPCTTGSEPSCPQPPPCTSGYEPSCPCVTGDEPSCPPKRTWWEEIIDVVSDLPPWVWLIPAVVIGCGVVYWIRPDRPVPDPISTPDPTPVPTPAPTPSPAPTSPPPIDVVTTYPAAPAPRVTSKGSGPKTPIVSLVVNTTRVIPRIIATTQSREDQDG